MLNSLSSINSHDNLEPSTQKNFSSLINSSMKAYLRIRRQMATTLLIPILSFRAADFCSL